MVRKRLICTTMVLLVVASACTRSTADVSARSSSASPASRPSTTVAPPETAAPPTTTTAAPTSTVPTSTTFVPPGVDPESGCLRRARFGDPAESEYLLPFNVGEAYTISQSYCYASGGHKGQLAYDFVMPVGVDVLAARGGTVMSIKEDSPDNGRGEGKHNYVFIEHDDGTVAFYAHLMQDGVDVGLGDEVVAGQRIAASGNSGLTGRPHLHFGVYLWWPPEERFDVPVNFRNADGPLDPNGGLRPREYLALPHE